MRCRLAAIVLFFSLNRWLSSNLDKLLGSSTCQGSTRWYSQSAIDTVPILWGPCWRLLLSNGLSSVKLPQLSEESAHLCACTIMVIQSCGCFQYLSSRTSPGTLFCKRSRKRPRLSCNSSQLHLPATLVLTQALLACRHPYFCMGETPSSVYLRPSISSTICKGGEYFNHLWANTADLQRCCRDTFLC